MSFEVGDTILEPDKVLEFVSFLVPDNLLDPAVHQ